MIFEFALYVTAVVTVLAIYGSRSNVRVPVVCASSVPVECDSFSDLPLDELPEVWYDPDVPVEEIVTVPVDVPVECASEETVTTPLDFKHFMGYTTRELRPMAKGIIPGFSKMRKEDLAHRLAQYYGQ